LVQENGTIADERCGKAKWGESFKADGGSISMGIEHYERMV